MLAGVATSVVGEITWSQRLKEVARTGQGATGSVSHNVYSFRFYRLIVAWFINSGPHLSESLCSLGCVLNGTPCSIITLVWSPVGYGGDVSVKAFVLSSMSAACRVLKIL
jgi:hypothetical protein